MQRREEFFIFALAGLLALFITVQGASDLVLYNPTPSMPVGFYLRTDEEIVRGAIVTIRIPQPAIAYAEQRGAGPRFRFLKRVAAASGDVVCAAETQVTINGALSAMRQIRDGAGRELPTWIGCRTLRDDEFFVLGDAADSFDGRYWGPIPRTIIEGVWRPL